MDASVGGQWTRGFRRTLVRLKLTGNSSGSKKTVFQTNSREVEVVESPIESTPDSVSDELS